MTTITLTSRLVLNEAEVASETLDGEAIIINLANGSYYSAAGTAGVLWDELAKGATLDAASRGLVALYDVDIEQAQRDVLVFAGELLDEQLVTHEEAGADGESSPEPADDNAPGGERLPYATPALEAYRDMAEMLALDPPMPALRHIDLDAPTSDDGREG